MASIITTLIAAQYGSVSDIEVVWTLIAAAGIFFTLYNIRDAYGDYKALPKTINNGRRTVALTSIKLEAARMAILVIFFTIGVIALTIPDHVDQVTIPLKTAILGALIRWGLVISGLLILYQSYTNYRLRRKLLHDEH